MPDCKWPDLAGRIERDGAGVIHRLAVRVYFEDTDFSGVVYHASYVRWCERGRSDLLRLPGNSHRALLKGDDGAEPTVFVLRRMSLEFLKPARIDDILTVETRIKEIGGAFLKMEQGIRRGEHLIFEADVMVVLISLSGKPQRISQYMRSALLSEVP